MTVVSGSSADGLFVGNGDTLYVYSGGLVTNTTVEGTGEADIGNSGTADASYVAASGTVYVESGGSTEGTEVGSSGTEQVAGGTTDFTVISAGGTQEVDSGTANDSLVSGGQQLIIDGTVEGTTLVAGGIQLVGDTTVFIQSSSAQVDGTTISSGGTQLLFQQGPSEVFYQGGAVIATVTSSAGVLVLSYGPTEGAAAGAEIREVQDGGEVYASYIGPDGTVEDTASNTGYISLPAEVTNTTILSGGLLQFEGGTVTGITTQPGALEQVGGTFTFSGSTLSTSEITISNNVVGDGVTETVAGNGTVVSTIVQAGGIEDIASGGIASNTTVLSDGFQYVETGGTVSGGTVSAGGIQYVESGATASNVHVLSGGTQYDLAGAADDDTTVSAGGTLYVSSGGGESDVSDGGTEVILAGGSGGGIKIDNSGILSFSDSTAVGTNTVYAGGVVVFSGTGTAANATFIVSGTGAPIDAPMSFTGGELNTEPSNFPRLEAVDFADRGVGAVLFQDNSTAANATITNVPGNAVAFEDNSTAGAATIDNEQGTTSNGAVTLFINNATAGTADIEVDSDSVILFGDKSTAASATITLDAVSGGTGLQSIGVFANGASAGQAEITISGAGADSGPALLFVGSATGGQATFDNSARTSTDLSRAVASAVQQLLAGANEEVVATQLDMAAQMYPNQPAVPIGGLIFTGGTTAGTATINDTGYGLTEFYGDSTSEPAMAGGATITNSGSMATTLFALANANSATIINQDGGSTVFTNFSNANTATIENVGGVTLFLAPGNVDTTTAGGAHITNTSGGATLFVNATLGSATIDNTSGVTAIGNGDASSATINIGASGALVMAFDARGDMATVNTTDATALVDLSALQSDYLNGKHFVTLGSIAGPGQFYLGGNDLMVGATNASTVIDADGKISNGGIAANSANGLTTSGLYNFLGVAMLEKVGSGSLMISGTVISTNLTVDAGRLGVFGTISGGSTGTISGGGILELGGSADAESVTFAQGAAGTLQLDAPGSYTGAVGSFGLGDTIELGVGYAAGATASASGSAIQVTDGGQSFVIALASPAMGEVTAGMAADGMLAITVSGTVISTAQDVSSGETLSSAVVVSGGDLTVSSGGTISGDTIDSGGVVSVGSGASDDGTTVNDGGQDIVQSGGSASGTVLNDPGAQVVMAGGSSTSAQIDGGEQDVYGSSIDATITSGGIQIVESGGLVTGTDVGSGGTLVLSGGTASGIALQLGGSVDFTSLAFNSFGFTFSGNASVDPASDILTVMEGTGSATLPLTGDYSAYGFQLAGDGGTGTLVTAEATPCYCYGTLILTDCGDRPVETLAVGDTLITASGQHRPIRWIGRRAFAGRFLAANPGAQPIRFRAGSLGDGLPRRDLLVSPEHAMMLDGLLIPARCVVNGTTIVRVRGLDRVDYFHVELEQHSVIYAEGAPSETFLDDDSRGMFHNAFEYPALHPDAPEPGTFCAPRVTEGYRLEAIRQRLAVAAA